MKGTLKDKPCQGCTERTPTCHGSCKEYLEAIERQAEKRRAAYQESRGNGDYLATKRSAIRRTLQKVRNRKGRK